MSGPALAHDRGWASLVDSPAALLATHNSRLTFGQQ